MVKACVVLQRSWVQFSGPTRWLTALQRTWHPPLASSGTKQAHDTTPCIQAKHKTPNNEPLKKQKNLKFQNVFKIVHVHSKNANGSLSGRLKPTFSYPSSNSSYRDNHSNDLIMLIANNFCIYKNVTFFSCRLYHNFFSKYPLHFWNYIEHFLISQHLYLLYFITIYCMDVT